MYHHLFELSFRYRNHTLISQNFLIRTYRLLFTCFQLPRSLVQNLLPGKLLRSVVNAVVFLEPRPKWSMVRHVKSNPLPKDSGSNPQPEGFEPMTKVSWRNPITNCTILDPLIGSTRANQYQQFTRVETDAVL
jgi:hypothetical protein